MDKKQWLEKMQSLMDKCPDGHWLFCDGNLHLMRYEKNKKRATTKFGAMDQDYKVGTLTGPEMDGGDW